jgi:putative ABC transport system substrate-binding protein
MKRRAAVCLLAGLAAQPPLVHGQAQANGRPWRIGGLASRDEALNRPLQERWSAQLSALGYVPGRHFVFESRYANGDASKLPALARELVATRPDVIIAGEPALTILKQATTTIPIVMWGAPNPVESGLVASLRRPGGNITGAAGNVAGLAGKRIEILKAVAPTIRRIVVVLNPTVPGMNAARQPWEKTARELGIEVRYVEVSRAGEFDREALERLRPDALYVTYDYAVGSIARELAQFGRDRRIPTLGVVPEFVEMGGLMSLTIDIKQFDAVIADYIDRILRGANPATMPVWMPSRFWLVLSRGTAAAIGLPLQPDFLLRVDEVVE